MIGLHGCADLFQSSLYAHANVYVVLGTGSFFAGQLWSSVNLWPVDVFTIITFLSVYINIALFCLD